MAGLGIEKSPFRSYLSGDMQRVGIGTSSSYILYSMTLEQMQIYSTLQLNIQYQGHYSLCLQFLMT